MHQFANVPRLSSMPERLRLSTCRYKGSALTYLAVTIAANASGVSRLFEIMLADFGAVMIRLLVCVFSY